ncbi:MAG: TRAP transporter small permease [Rhodospirillales bacterium]|nr:TRAP transporter small permease [Rhodospirillales bacterium]
MFASIVNRLEEGIIALLLAAMTLLTFSQVVARYVFNTGAVWALEATEFLFAWMIFLGISYGVKVGGHIGVDAAVKLFPRRGQQVIGLLGAAACIAYSAIVVYGSWIYVSKLHMIGVEAQEIPIPRWIPLTVLPIGFGLLGYRFLEVLVRILRGTQTGIGLADEAKEAMKIDLDHPGARR